MSKLSQRISTSWAALVGAGLTAGLGLFLLETPFGQGLENLSLDLLTVMRGDQPVDEAVIVYMDDAAYQRLDQPLDAPWDRSLHVRLLDRLTAAGARAVVFDIVFSHPSADRPEVDEALAQAMERQGGVVLGVDHVPDGPGAKRFVPPFELLQDAAAGLGSVELDPSRDLIVRRHAPLDELVPPMSWAAAALVEAEVTKNSDDAPAQRWINYYGPPNYLPWVSYHEALDPARVADDYFKGRVVFVGDRRMTKFAGERKDEYRNPFSYWLVDALRSEQGTPFISGVEIQATAFLNYGRGDWLNRTARAAERVWVLVLGGLCGLILVRLRPAAALGLGAVGLGTVVAAAYVYFVSALVWIPWLIFVVQIGAALVASISYNSVQLYVQKRMFEYTLGLYLSPKLVKRFSRERNFLKPGGEEQIITIMFTDIANFTDHTQAMDSDTLAHLMNRYFHAAVTECIHVTDGTVVKYIGDAVFAFWNAPEAQEDHALRACRAALLLCHKKFNWPQGDPLITRIGVHTGLARVGNFGSPDRVDYTALGENVNLASRLEGLNKYMGTSCLISGATYQQIAGQMVTRRLGSFQLKGFDTPVEVFELVGELEVEESTKPWREEFARALENYEKGELELAAMGFRATKDLLPDDGPCKFYEARMDELGGQPLPEDWSGQTQLWEK